MQYRLALLTSEWIAFGYFGALTVLAWIRRLSARRRVVITVVGLTISAAALSLRRHVGAPIWNVAPLAWVLIGYYLSGLFFIAPSPRFEAWLMAWDRRLLGDPTTRFTGWPRAWLAFLDIIYMGCFLLLPAGAAAYFVSGRDLYWDRYWTMVMAAEFGAFLPLAIVQSRPPWAIEHEAAPRDRPVNHVNHVNHVHRAALRFVRELTIGVNTFPSGHAAGSLAVALAVIGVLPLTGAVLLFLALCICLASVVGRYHYVMDVVTGIALALAIWLTLG